MRAAYGRHNVSVSDGFEKAFPARPESSSQLRFALRRYLKSWLDGRRLDDVVLAASEAAGNVIEHAYTGSGGVVKVRAGVVNDKLVVEVSDRGRWRLDGDPERGRGLAIMRALVDRVTIESTAGGTSVRLEVAL